MNSSKKMNQGSESEFNGYAERLVSILAHRNWADVVLLAHTMRKVWAAGHQCFLCGNGGSAGNAIHLANDFLYGIGGSVRTGMKVEALPANSAVTSCLANDVGYEHIFSIQLEAKASKNDLLIALTGSGKSENIINVLEVARKLGLTTCAITGLSGGKCREMADLSIHFPDADMQLAEDLQLIVGHMCMQWLAGNRP